MAEELEDAVLGYSLGTGWSDWKVRDWQFSGFRQELVPEGKVPKNKGLFDALVGDGKGTTEEEKATLRLKAWQKWLREAKEGKGFCEQVPKETEHFRKPARIEVADIAQAMASLSGRKSCLDSYQRLSFRVEIVEGPVTRPECQLLGAVAEFMQVQYEVKFVETGDEEEDEDDDDGEVKGEEQPE